jgi:hypothetical protein
MNNQNLLPEIDNNITAFPFRYLFELDKSLVESWHANVKKSYARTSNIVSANQYSVMSDFSVVPTIAVGGVFFTGIESGLLKGSVTRTLLQTIACQQMTGSRKCSVSTASRKALDLPLALFQ